MRIKMLNIKIKCHMIKNYGTWKYFMIYLPIVNEVLDVFSVFHYLLWSQI